MLDKNILDQYPANQGYEYYTDDILRVFEKYILNHGYRIRPVGNKIIVETIFEDADSLAVKPDFLPAMVVDRAAETKKFNRQGIQYDIVIACPIEQYLVSHDKEHPTFSFIKDVLTKKERNYLVLFPHHIPGGLNGQSGHWNLAALYINIIHSSIFLDIYEPLSSDELIDEAFFKQNFWNNLLAETVKCTIKGTAQQADSKLCGVIAGENILFFLENSALSADFEYPKYISTKEIKALREKHIFLIDSQSFAKRQYDNQQYVGSKNDNYEKAKGEQIFHILKAAFLKDPESMFSKELKELMDKIEKLPKTCDTLEILEPCRIFFRTHQEILKEKKVFSQFFIEINGELTINSKWNTIELFKYLAEDFCKVVQDKFSSDSTIEKNPVKSSFMYKRAQGYSNTYRGDEYQKLVGMYYALSCYRQTGVNFSVYSERLDGEIDLGKFDDLELETDADFKVVQVKHAGSTNANSQIYTLEMICGEETATQKEKSKKAALHIYFNSFQRIKKSNKTGKPVTFMFYTNHRLDPRILYFYNRESEKFTKLLDEHKGKEKEDQRKIINSIYQSEFFKERVADKIYTDTVLVFKELSNEERLIKIIDDNIDYVIEYWLSNRTTLGEKRKIEKKFTDNKAVVFLLMGCFDYERESKKIVLSQDFFSKNFSEKPLHHYFQKKLARKKHAKMRDKEVGIEKFYTESLHDLSKKIHERNLNFDDKGLRIKIESQPMLFSFFTGGISSEIKVDAVSLFFPKREMLNLIKSHPKLPIPSFDSSAKIDKEIVEFINEFIFKIEQPNLNFLEERIVKEVCNLFRISDLTYYYKFQDYFLKNFRSPLGERINRKTITTLFNDASQAVLAQRLVGYSDRYVDNLSKGKLDIVANKTFTLLNTAFSDVNCSVIIFYGEKNIGKSFTIASWIKQQYLKNGNSATDSHAFLPKDHVWESDVETFANKLNLLVVDEVNLQLLDATILLKLVDVANNFKKKLILIVDKESLEKFCGLLSGYKTILIESLPMNNEQVLNLLGLSENFNFSFKNIQININDILTWRDPCGISHVLRNPGFLLQMKESRYIEWGAEKKNLSEGAKAHKTKERNEKVIYIEQLVRVRRYLKFSKYLEKISGTVLIVNVSNDFKIEKYINKDIKKDIEIIDYRKPKLSQKKESEAKKQNKKLIILTKDKDHLIQSREDIKEICFSPNDKGLVELIKTQVDFEEEWQETEGESIVCLLEKDVSKKVLVPVVAGMGKSTVVAKLSEINTRKYLKETDYVWKIPIYLDELTQEDDALSLTDFCMKKLMHIYDVGGDPFKKDLDWLRTALRIDIEQGNVLLLLDGGDQLEKWQLSSCKQILERLIHYQHVILFTRPNQLAFVYYPTEVVILQPFEFEQIKAYFKDAFDASKTQNSFYNMAIKFMKDNVQLKEILGVPLQCYLLWQAWQPYYNKWLSHKTDENLALQLANSPNTLIELYQKFIEARMLIFFRRVLKISSGFLQEIERVRLLGTCYIDRLSQISVFKQFSGLDKFIEPLVCPIVEWLDEDILKLALVKRVKKSLVLKVDYILSHRTYQEYLAAKFFVEGMLGMRATMPKQEEYCKSLLKYARFFTRYQLFWSFVLKWIRHHIAIGLLPKDAEENFHNIYCSDPDIIRDLQDKYWQALQEGGNFPEAYKPDFSFSNLPLDKIAPTETIASSDNEIFVINFSFNQVKSIVESYKGRIYNYYDSDICMAIRHIAFYKKEDLNERLSLLQHAQQPNGKIHESFRVHEAIAETLLAILSENQEISVLKGILFYIEYFNELTREIKSHVLPVILTALQKAPPIKDTIDAVIFLLNYDETNFNSVFSVAISALERTYANKKKKELAENILKNIVDCSEKLNVSSRTLQYLVTLAKHCREYNIELTSREIKKVKNSQIQIFLCFSFWGESYKSHHDKKCIIDPIISHINKDSIKNLVIIFESEEMPAFSLWAQWLGLKLDTQLSSSIDTEYYKHLQQLSQGFLDSTRSDYSQVDGGIPAACQLQSAFNETAAVYLIKKQDEPYWQYPVVLSTHIPFLLSFYSETNEYPRLALCVYLSFLKKILKSEQMKLSNLPTFFNHHKVNAVQAVQYGWDNYQRHNIKEGLKIVKCWTEFLNWPLFKASNRLALTLLSPVTEDACDLITESGEKLENITKFF